jgi:hypothetical protein
LNAYKDVVNVKDYGAKGDGSDDTAFIGWLAVVAAVGSPSHGGLVTPGSGTVFEQAPLFSSWILSNWDDQLTGVSGLLISRCGNVLLLVIENQGGTVFQLATVCNTLAGRICASSQEITAPAVILDLTAAGVCALLR